MELNPVLIFSSFPSYLAPLKTSGTTILTALSKIGIAKRILRKICFVFKDLPISPWLNFKLTDISDYNTVILFANEYTNRILHELYALYPNKQYIMWYWNPVKKSLLPKNILKRPNVIICSFDYNDARRYNLRFVETFSVHNLNGKQNYTHPSTYDIFFIGQDKGRASFLNNLNEEFKKLGLTTRIDIIRDSSSKKKHENCYASPLDYKDVLKILEQSTCILDIPQEGQVGLTQRIFEAISFKKKIITCNRHIIDTKLYHPNRVFIIGKDNFSDLKSFINSPLPSLDYETSSYFSIDSWMNRLNSKND